MKLPRMLICRKPSAPVVSGCVCCPSGVAEAEGGLPPGPADNDAKGAPPKAAAMTQQLAQPHPSGAEGCRHVDSLAATATARGAGTAAHRGQPSAAIESAAVQSPPSKRQRQDPQPSADGSGTNDAPASPAALQGPEAATAAEASVRAAAAAAQVRQNVCPLPLRYLRVHDTTWQPGDAKPTLNVRLDGRIVQSAAGGARIAYSHIVVLDDFIDEQTRAELLAFLTAPGGSSSAGSSVSATATETSASSQLPAAVGGRPAADVAAGLPSDRWERRTADQAGLVATWGVKVQ